MRIVQINSYSNGSTGHIANSIHQALIQNGNESLFAYGNGPDIPNGGCRIGSKADFSVHTLVTLFTGLHGYSSVLSTCRFIHKLKKFDPEIIHLHNLHGGYLNLPMLFRYINKHHIRTVVTLHDCWLYTGKCYHYYEANCDKFLHKCVNCPQLSMYPKSYFLDFTSKMLRDKKKLIGAIENLHVVAISNWLKSQVEKTFVGTHPTSIIHNGANGIYRYCDGLHSDKLPEQIAKKFVILGVSSSWNEHKGISDFITLAQMLSSDEVIVLVGHIKSDTQLPHNIFTIDHTENAEELVQLYNVASVYVSLSTEESFGLTIAEALCCGTPSIVYHATACPEMIVDGQNGYSVQPHNIQQVYEKIQLVKNRTLCDSRTISDNARKEYSAQHMVDAYLSLYKGVLD